jgi:DNA invertase Pin-like site-specific DNA recombinase
MARTLKPKDTALVVKWYAIHGSTRKTAKYLRCSRGTVLRHLRAAGVEMRPVGRPRA